MAHSTIILLTELVMTGYASSLFKAQKFIKFIYTVVLSPGATISYKITGIVGEFWKLCWLPARTDLYLMRAPIRRLLTGSASVRAMLCRPTFITWCAFAKQLLPLNPGEDLTITCNIYMAVKRQSLTRIYGSIIVSANIKWLQMVGCMLVQWRKTQKIDRGRLRTPFHLKMNLDWIWNESIKFNHCF